MRHHKGEWDVARFLYCSSILEDKMFVLYRRLSEKVEHLMARSLLLYIAYDSLKHSVILKETSELLAKQEMLVGDCERQLGNIWRMAVTFSEEVSKKETINDEELSSLTDTLLALVQSRHSTLVPRLKTFQAMAKELNEMCEMDSEDLRGVIELIIGDEERLLEIMTVIRNISVKKEEGKKEGETVKYEAPIVKYQNPDAWRV